MMVQMAAEPTTDPDAQATVTDFLDYTEYLPADIIRSLTLIRGLDETFSKNAYTIHQQTRQYGSLPKLPVSSRPDPQGLRTAISTHLDQALSARGASHAEAGRLLDITDRHYNRLSSIVTKLRALPKPPSRDPSPNSGSAEKKRSRSDNVLDDGTSTQRLTLNPPRAPAIPAHIVPKPGNRRITVSRGDVVHLNPDSPIASTEQSDWDSDGGSLSRINSNAPPPQRPTSLKSRKPKISRDPRIPHESAVPYKMPTPPPEGSQLGGEHRPWIRLTDWEMWKLRKKMKKNINWEPSGIMIQRELADKGRGWENYHKARAEASTHGRELLDVDNLDKSLANGDLTGTGEIPRGDAVTVRNRGMKLNEAKKLKREALVREQAATAAAEAEAAARRLGDIGSAFKNLFSPLGDALASLNVSASSPIANDTNLVGKRSSRKRKRDGSSVAPSPPAESVPTQKRQKIDMTDPPPPLNEDTEMTAMPPNVSLPAAGSSPLSSLSTPNSPTPRANSSPLTSIVPKTELTPPIPFRPSSRHLRRRSVGANSTATATTTNNNNQPVSLPTRSSRRKSTPGHKSTATLPDPASARNAHAHTQNFPNNPLTAASSRPKREAPGQITQTSADGGATVSVSKRKIRPALRSKLPPPSPSQSTTTTTNKQDPTTSSTRPEIRIDIDGKTEVIDPDEERFCVCADVSWGEMICCEMDDRCEDGQWFHLGCVGLVELPARTVKWYSPACRRKWKKGVESGGCVGRGIK